MVNWIVFNIGIPTPLFRLTLQNISHLELHTHKLCTKTYNKKEEPKKSQARHEQDIKTKGQDIYNLSITYPLLKNHKNTNQYYTNYLNNNNYLYTIHSSIYAYPGCCTLAVSVFMIIFNLLDLYNTKWLDLYMTLIQLYPYLIIEKLVYNTNKDGPIFDSHIINPFQPIIFTPAT